MNQHYQQLKDFETNHPLLIDPNSPTQRVGSEPETGFKQHTHKTPLYLYPMHLTNKILPTF